MTNFEVVQNNIKRLDQIEGELKSLRDNAGDLTKPVINDSLRIIMVLYDNLNKIDSALEKEGLGSIKY